MSAPLPLPPKDFYNLVEQDDYLEHIIYGDTDSLFIHIPEYGMPDVKDKLRLVNKTAKDINSLVVQYMTDYYIPKCGFSSKYNEVNFKEEMVIDKMLFLDIKKTYAYRQLTKEAELNEAGELVGGKIFKKPKIVLTSNLGIKSDLAELSKMIMSDAVDVAFMDISPKEQFDKLCEMAKEHSRIFREAFKEHRYSIVGIPCRWNKDPAVIKPMQLYNEVVENVFQNMISGYKIYCTFTSRAAIKRLKGDYDKIDCIVIPLEPDVPKLMDGMQKFGIQFDLKTQWEKINNKTIERLIDDFRKRSKQAE